MKSSAMQFQQHKSSWPIFYIHACVYALVYTLMSLERVVVYVSWVQLVCMIAKPARNASQTLISPCLACSLLLIDGTPTSEKQQTHLMGPPDADWFPFWKGIPPHPHIAVLLPAQETCCTPCTYPMPHTSPSGEMPKCRAPASLTYFPSLLKLSLCPISFTVPTGDC